MDNSAYVPNQLPPPLVVFSQAGGFSEAALRMQRPFNPQIGETKELQSPFGQAAASLDYRLHQHMLHLQHQFLHPLEHRLPFGSAFRPLAPSAFAPPQKRLKLETEAGPASGPSAAAAAAAAAAASSRGVVPTGLSSLGSLSSMSSMFSPSVASQATDLAPQSPANSTSRSPPGSGGSNQAAAPGNQAGEEEREANATPCSENTERSTPEEGRPYRRKKKFSADPTCCPVCGVTVRPQDLEQHFLQELDRLYKLSSVSSRPRPPRPNLPPSAPEHPHGQLLHTPSAADGTPIGRWETYKRTKANRLARIRIKNRKRKADEPACPVCSERLSGTADELNQHVERCLNKHNGNPDDEEVDVEGDTETFEEYEWAGQRRVRASSMLLGGYSAAGLATSSSHRNSSGNPNGARNPDATAPHDDEDVDLVVDGDETAQFGPSQYTEADVITPRLEGSAREQKEREALREAVISPNGTQTQVEVKTEPSASPGSTSQLQQQHQGQEGEETALTSSPSTATAMLVDAKSEPETQVVEALRGRIRELEAEMRGQAFKCLICMEQYKKPVTSVCCWHVHCEQCWLHTLGAKKLCPQCNMITSPSDLRRIYM